MKVNLTFETRQKETKWFSYAIIMVLLVGLAFYKPALLDKVITAGIVVKQAITANRK